MLDAIAKVLPEVVHGAGSRIEVQWRESRDTLSWEEWKHLCWLDEPTPKNVPMPPIDMAEFIQIRGVRDGEVLWQSPFFYWP